MNFIFNGRSTPYSPFIKSDDTKPKPSTQAVSNGLNQFSTNFYQETSNVIPGGNVICSPLSIGMVLSMAAEGAIGRTKTQIVDSLQLPHEREVCLEGFQNLTDSLNDVQDVTLNLANKIFVDSEVLMKTEFEEVTLDFFRSKAEKFDLMNKAKACQIVNSWCANKTNNLIRNIISPENLTDAAMILLNAVYFKGMWKKKFSPFNTKNRKFYINNHKTVEVPMMEQLNLYKYGQLPELDATFVELPYQFTHAKDATSMLIIRPNEIEGLKTAQDNLHKISFNDIHQRGMKTDVKLKLPKFEISSDLSVNQILKNMGMTEMFEANADFGGISEFPINVSTVIHKAVIKVNEEGSEAAAVSVMAVAFGSSSSQRQILELTIDRPFIYIIYHLKTNCILFQGHIREFPA